MSKLIFQVILNPSCCSAWLKLVQKYWKGNSDQICLNLIYFYIIMSLISRGSVAMNNKSLFLLRFQLARPSAASRWLQPPPVILIHLSSHPLGDFMSELVIITGDCFLTFLLRSIRSGAAPLGRLSLSMWECLRSEGRQGFTSAPHTSACTSRGETSRLEHNSGNCRKCGSLFGCCWSLPCWRSWAPLGVVIWALVHVCIWNITPYLLFCL